MIVFISVVMALIFVVGAALAAITAGVIYSAVKSGQGLSGLKIGWGFFAMLIFPVAWFAALIFGR